MIKHTGSTPFPCILRAVAGLGLIMFAQALALAAPLVQSTFDSGTEAWTTVNNAGVLPTHSVSGGNPGGFITSIDSQGVVYWYFSAPGKFLGNQSAALSGTLSWDLRLSDIDSLGSDQPDVLLVGGGLTLALDLPTPNSANVWMSRSVALNASGGWRLNSLTGAAATDSDLQTVLNSLSALQIRAEFRTGGPQDVGDLDNVAINGATVPEPTSVALLGVGLTALLTMRATRVREQESARS